jgi:hypothetical protein
MPEVGRQGGETRFYLEPTAVPVQQGLHGEAMTKMPNSAFAASRSRPHTPRMVSRRDRCRAAAPRAFHLPRPHLRARHLLVSFSVSRTDGRGGPPSRSTLGGHTMRPRRRPIASGQIYACRLRTLSVTGIQTGIAPRHEALSTPPDYVV